MHQIVTSMLVFFNVRMQYAMIAYILEILV